MYSHNQRHVLLACLRCIQLTRSILQVSRLDNTMILFLASLPQDEYQLVLQFLRNLKSVR